MIDEPDEPDDPRPLQVGDVVPLPRRKLSIRPNAPIDNRPSFLPSRGPRK